MHKTTPTHIEEREIIIIIRYLKPENLDKYKLSLLNNPASRQNYIRPFHLESNRKSDRR